ncbi:MAG: ornithine carbamoyltransferase [Coriobacteriia bacterium]|nr:ornithine carbamoyltransferase [Coriobacteriia bacterium]
MQQLIGRDILTLGELTPEEFSAFMDRASAQKRAAKAAAFRPLAGKSVAIIMLKPSLRTRVSFEVACEKLGATPVLLIGEGSAFSRGESVKDTVKVLERYVDCIVLRTYDQSHIEEVALHASVPVINALTDDYHPCQVLADLLTINEHKGRLAGISATYVGDGNNMANTLLIGAALCGMHMTVACPPGFEPAKAALTRASEIASQTGSRLSVVRNPMEAVAGADVVITDTWASMGQEAEHEERVKQFRPYQVNEALMEVAASDAIFLHCLPAHRGEEVTDAVIDSPASVVYDEAENRMHAQKALLTLVMG